MRDALLSLLTRAAALLASGVPPWRALTQAEADAILAAFDAGEIPPEAVADLLPLAPREAGIRASEEALGEALYTLHVLAGLTEAEATQAALGGVVRIVETDRARAFVRVTAGFEERLFPVSRSVARGGPVATWQRAMMREIRSEVLGAFSLGLGREPLASETRTVQSILDREAGYLSRFADEIASRRALALATGDPSKAFSEAYVRERASQYGGAAREMHFRGIESRRGDGWVFRYLDRDDGGVCPPCREAAKGGPYLAQSGPYPGTVCRARGKCRCRREPVFSPSDYARLRAETGPTAASGA